VTWTYHLDYGGDEPALVLCDTPPWAVVLDELGAVLIRHARTYRLGNWILVKIDTTNRPLAKLPVPDHVHKALYAEDWDSPEGSVYDE
jgi:hypothetical protein